MRLKVKAVCLSLISSLWERESSRVGCSAVLTFARVPLCLPVWSWWEFRPQCVLLYLVIDPADQSHRGLAGTLSSICDGGGLINVTAIHFHSCKSSPPRGRSAGRSLALRTVVPHKQQGFSYLSFCQCLYSGRLRCIPAEGLACFSPFSSPLSFNHVTRAELLRLGLVHPGNGSYSGTPSSVHWDVSSEASSVRAGEEVG